MILCISPEAESLGRKQLDLPSKGFPGGAVVKNLPAAQGLIAVLGRSPGEGNGCPLQYSCLENPMDRGAWWATVHGLTKSQTRLKPLSRQAGM